MKHVKAADNLYRTAVALFLLVVAGCSGEHHAGNGTADNGSGPTIAVKQLVGSEELILELTKEIKHLNRDIMNLSLGLYSRSLFKERVSVNPLYLNAVEQVPSQLVNLKVLIPDTEMTMVASGEIWSSLFTKVAYFSHAKIYFVSGEFESAERTRFHSKMGFEAIARTRDDAWESIEGKLLVDWERPVDSDPSSAKSWKIASLRTERLDFRRAEELLFVEILDELCGAQLADRMRYSQHDAYMSKLVSTGTVAIDSRRLGKYFSAGQTVQHPGICAVDVNGDGWEDLYICDEWLPNKLLINEQGNGFREAAREYGLDIVNPSTSAIFADFDNDGDMDAFVGRCYDRSVLLINEDGVFVDRTSQNLACEIPFLVTSVAATDFNNDGLIDLYLSTYGFASGNQRFKDWADDFLSPSDHDRYARLLNEQHRFLSAFGPSNLLLQNMGGGKFAAAAENKYIDHNHNTFQSVWSDYDQDGDQDLYVSNDYAQDFLYRNDRGTFTDVTFEVGSEEMMGFGMGAAWGDYDADGDFDLYVSNMYSKAGMRILNQISGLDDRFYQLANGNRLYNQQDGKLQCLPSTDENAARAGWSWGGQFTDFDNDGLLDIYVGSGFLTSPFEDEFVKDL